MNKSIYLVGALILLVNLQVTIADECAGANTNGIQGACYCAKGFWGTVNETAHQNTACKKCVNSTTDTPGDTNTGPNVNISACNRCPANTFMKTPAQTTSDSEAAAVCKDCPQLSQSKESSTPGFCTCMDPNAAELSVNQASCQCKAGTSGAASNSTTTGCVACPVGKISAVNGQCTNCNAGQTSNAEKTACENCKKGYTSTVGSSDGCVKLDAGETPDSGNPSTNSIKLVASCVMILITMLF